LVDQALGIEAVGLHGYFQFLK